MKSLCSALLDCVVAPLHDRLDEWRRTAAALDKDHAKEYKKLRAEIKKKAEVRGGEELIHFTDGYFREFSYPEFHS